MYGLKISTLDQTLRLTDRVEYRSGTKIGTGIQNAGNHVAMNLIKMLRAYYFSKKI